MDGWMDGWREGGSRYVCLCMHVVHLWAKKCVCGAVVWHVLLMMCRGRSGAGGPDAAPAVAAARYRRNAGAPAGERRAVRVLGLRAGDVCVEVDVAGPRLVAISLDLVPAPQQQGASFESKCQRMHGRNGAHVVRVRLRMVGLEQRG